MLYIHTEVKDHHPPEQNICSRDIGQHGKKVPDPTVCIIIGYLEFKFNCLRFEITFVKLILLMNYMI